MSVNTIESELVKMTDAERQNIIDIATKLLRNDSGDARQLSLEEKRRKLKESAKFMHDYYLHDKEVTVWRALDGEEFSGVLGAMFGS